MTKPARGTRDIEIRACTRRDVLKAISVGAASLAVPWGRTAAVSAGNKPNIILIMADDIGYECFGCYGGESYATPHIDKLAATGVRFTHCYSQPLCTPSRVKLMTGQSNIRNYTHFSILDPKEKTFGPMMQQAGYRTAVVGKWQLYGAAGYGPLARTGTHPRDAGFDEYCLWQIDRRESRYWGPLIERNGRVLSDVEDRYGPDVFCEFIGEFLEKHRKHPVFVYYPMVLVHNPFVRTPDSKERQRKDRHANFADMVAYMDKIIGRIVARLDELGRRDNTLVLFTSDNGTNRAITSRANGRAIAGGKGLTTDAGTRVPLVASCPGFMSAGRVCGDLVDFSDFLPTLAETAGAKLRSGVTIDGRSFLPQLKGEKGRPREWIFCYHNPRPGNRKWPERCFVRDRRWKLYRSGKLYDIQNDVLEQHPLKDGEGGAEAAVARKRLRAALDSMPAKPAKIGK